MKVTITNEIPEKKALRLVLLADQEGLYHRHLELTCSGCGWGVELHRNITGKPEHFEHKDGNPEVCVGPV